MQDRAKSRDPGLENKLFSCLQNFFLCRATSCQFSFLSMVHLSCSFNCLSKRTLRIMLGSCFKFTGSGKYRRIWKILMQVWRKGFHGFSREAVGLFVADSDEAELYFLFMAANFGVELKLRKGQGLHVIWGEKSSVNAVSTLTLLPTGGLLARTIRLLTITLQRLYLAPSNLVTFCFYLLDTFWQNFSKID